MQYEVEQKFVVADVGEVQEHLTALGAEFGETVEQIDRYFAHPCRDFAQTDEALRIRSEGARNFITYKGPKLDPFTKTRREIELPMAPGSEQREQFSLLLHALGFTVVAEVSKVRREAGLCWQGTRFSAAIDTVAQVGTFVEIELLANEQELDAAREQLLALSAELHLGPPERRSYLELLLAAKTGAAAGGD